MVPIYPPIIAGFHSDVKVYREFKDVDSFLAELKELKKKQNRKK